MLRPPAPLWRGTMLRDISCIAYKMSPVPLPLSTEYPVDHPQCSPRPREWRRIWECPGMAMKIIEPQACVQGTRSCKISVQGTRKIQLNQPRNHEMLASAKNCFLQYIPMRKPGFQEPHMYGLRFKSRSKHRCGSNNKTIKMAAPNCTNIG